jgi:hypothetical protein
MSRHHDDWETTVTEDTFSALSRQEHPGGRVCGAIASFCSCVLLWDHDAGHRCVCGAGWFWYRPEEAGGRKGKGILTIDQLPTGQRPLWADA